MSANPMLGLAGSLATTFLNNRMAQENANTSYNRQKELMSMQSNMNMTNAMNAPGVQAFGLRQAGFNPAMVQGAGTQAAPTVSQGNADMPQTIPFNAQDALLFAQMENIDANTKKVKEETRSVEQQNDVVDTANDAAVKGYLADFNREQEDLTAALKTMKEDTPEYEKTQGRIRDIEKMKGRITDPGFRGALGLVKGTDAAAQNAEKRMKILHNYLTGAMANTVAQKELGNGTVEVLSTMKKAERDKLAQDIDHTKQLIEESKSKEGLNDKMVEEISQKIMQIGDAVLRAQLSDENFVRDNQSKWNYNLKVLQEAGFDKDGNEEHKKIYETVKEQSNLWNTRFENLTDTEMRKAVYDTGSRIISGVATGSAVGAASSVLQKMLNGEKITKKDLESLGKGTMDPYLVDKNGRNSEERRADSLYKLGGSGPDNSGVQQMNYMKKYHKSEQDQYMKKYNR